MGCGQCYGAGPRRIPLEGDDGPAFTGGATPPSSSSGSSWDRSPVALAIVVLFVAAILFKVVR